MEHKLETFSMPSTGTTSGHPKKKLLCRSERHSALNTQNYTVTLNTSLTRPTTRCHLNIPLSYRVSKTNKPKHHESCSTKNKPYSKLQIKNFRCCVVKAKFRNSFVALKKYSAKQLTISPHRYNIINNNYSNLQFIILNCITASICMLQLNGMGQCHPSLLNSEMK